MTTTSRAHRPGRAGFRPRSGVPDVAGELRRLTSRDRWLLDLLAEHQVLSTEHVAALGFDNVHTARNRLHLLTSRGVLTRFRDCVRPGSQSWRWMLGPVGAAFIAARDGTPTPGAGTLAAKTNRLSASPRLGHLLGVNGFFVDLAAHARHNRGAALSLWWSERTCGTVTGNLVHPDGHGVWVQDGRTVSFWLEYDNATEPTWRVLDKLTGYARLHRAADLDHTVLIRMQTDRQEHTLRARLGDHPGVTGGLRVATASGTGIHPAGAVWLPAGDTTRRRLADLPTTADHHAA